MQTCVFLIFAVTCLPQLCLAASITRGKSQIQTIPGPRGLEAQTIPGPRSLEAIPGPRGLKADKCPKGFHPGFDATSWQFTGVPATTFLDKTGSFLHGEWYAGPINSTHGKDNTIGATRTMIFDNSVTTERLVGHFRIPTESVMQFSLANGPISYKGLVFASYLEEVEVLSICGGKATYISMAGTYCTKKVLAGYNLYETYRREAVQNVADELGALVFTGTCPEATE